MAQVALEGVSKLFAGNVSAVDELTLEVNEHEFLVLVGPSGCGKSTTLRMIAGLEHPTAGVIRIGGQDVSGVPARKRNVALVFQNQPLFPHYSVEGNLAFGLRQRILGDWPTSIWKRVTKSRRAAESAAQRSDVQTLVRQAARELGVEHLLDRMPRQLSGGERQRIALGRAVVRNPAVFLLDEPLSSLDTNLRAELRDLLRRMHDVSNAATIHVTHDQAEAMALADRVAVMENGRLRQLGPPLEVYDRPGNRFVASFIGDPPMNLLAGKLVEDGIGWKFAGSGSAVELAHDERQGDTIQKLRHFAGREIELGIRPEHVELAPSTESDAQGDQAAFRVARVEQLGNESRVHVEDVKQAGSCNAEIRSRSYKLIAKTIERAVIQPGQIVTVRCQAWRAHWFDCRSGERLV